MSGREVSWLRRHPGVVLLAVNAVLFGVCALLAEVVLRLYVPYNPGYYVAVRGNSKEVEYPYGTIKINRDGFADIDFDLSHTRQVGYFGDSVTYGVGAGYGYRFSDLLRAAYPDLDHLNLGGVGLSVSQDTIDYSLELAERYGLDTAVYFMNLNDIVPDESVAPTGSDPNRAPAPWTYYLVGWLRDHTDGLRGKSYLYSWLRTVAKNQLEARGVGFHGFKAFELQPIAERAVLLETARRVEHFHDALAARGTELIVVLLPYEMQISEEAARVYQANGIHWEEEFIRGATQKILADALGQRMRVIDLLPAFVDPADPEGSRAKIAVGEYFVYNRGDKLDWNHPNRAGHRVIADYLKRIGLLGPTSGAASAVSAVSAAKAEPSE
ncbi:hypothetical protein K2X89_02805 [Myxococcota bacterium]|nr:hypothetical protein [Myxococcota bacterium]